jgi:hypothetical protein
VDGKYWGAELSTDICPNVGKSRTSLSRLTLACI